MGTLYIIVAILGITLVAFTAKIASTKGVSALDLSSTLFVASTAICFVLLTLHPSVALTDKAFYISSLPGICGGLAVVLFNYAIRTGHFGFSNMIYRTSFILPIIYSMLFLNEDLSTTVTLGIIFTLAAIFLMSYSGGAFKKLKSLEFKWFALIFLAFILSGGPRIGQRLASYHKIDTYAYLFISYLAGMLALLPLYLKHRKYSFKSAPYGLIAAVGSIVAVFCTISALKMGITSGTVFTITLSGPIILGLILSKLFFKEKINLFGWLGVVLGLAGLVLVYLVR